MPDTTMPTANATTPAADATTPATDVTNPATDAAKPATDATKPEAETSLPTADSVAAATDTDLVTGKRMPWQILPAANKAVRPDRPEAVPGWVYIPDVLANWRWPRFVNKYYDEVTKETKEWAIKSGGFKQSAIEAFDICDFTLLACMAYPHEDHETAGLGCEIMHMFFVIDEYSDVEPASEVARQKGIIMDVLRNPYKPRPEGEWVCGELTREWWVRALRRASPPSQKRMIENFENYLDAVIQQAADRDDDMRVRDIESFVMVRRYTVGAFPAFGVLEFCMDLPDEIMKHPVIQELAAGSVDMITVGNDMVSWSLEQARGDDIHNIVRIAMDAFDLDPQAAMYWVADYHGQLERKFMAGFDKIPKWGEPYDAQVKQFTEGLGAWVRANFQWSFESGRYLGAEGKKILETRWVKLLPKDYKQGMASRWI